MINSKSVYFFFYVIIYIHASTFLSFGKFSLGSFKSSVFFNLGRTKLLVEENKYDLIYIDGGKSSKTTIFQIVNCWQLLKENGILYMDDYGWGVNPPNEERPKEGIDFFLYLYKKDYELIFQNWQVAVIKK